MAIEAFDIAERYRSVGLPGLSAVTSGRPSLRLVETGTTEGQALAEIRPIAHCRTAREQSVLRHGEEVSARRAARHRVTVRRRRVALGLVTLGLLVGLALPVSVLGGRSPNAAATALPGAEDAGSHAVYVVQPGDTLATIARRIDPGHPAAMVRQLARETGSTTVVPGQHVPLP